MRQVSGYDVRPSSPLPVVLVVLAQIKKEPRAVEEVSDLFAFMHASVEGDVSTMSDFRVRPVTRNGPKQMRDLSSEARMYAHCFERGYSDTLSAREAKRTRYEEKRRLT